MDNAIAIDNNHLTMNDTARTLSGDHESRVTDTGTSIVQPAVCKTLSAETENAPTLSHQPSALEPTVAVSLDRYNQTSAAEVMHTLKTNAQTGDGGPTVAYNLDITPAHIVRRLTPRECERLQGFPDDWTRIPYRGKHADECPDSPRYKALGNSFATNCCEYVLRRIVAAFRLDMIPEVSP